MTAKEYHLHKMHEKYFQKKQQIISLINDLAIEMQNETVAFDKNDFLIEHEVKFSTNKFNIVFSFKDVRCS